MNNYINIKYLKITRLTVYVLMSELYSRIKITFTDNHPVSVF